MLVVQIQVELLVVLGPQQVVLVVDLVAQKVVIQFFLQLHQLVVEVAVLIEIHIVILFNQGDLEDQAEVVVDQKLVHP